MKAAFLPDRGVVKVTGDDARKFLDALVTSDLDKVAPGVARFTALLTPQGKIIADFFVTEASAGHGGGLLLDCPKPLAKPLADRLGFYKLRAKVAIENLSDSLGVMAAWDGEPAAVPPLAYPDPRDAALGWRILVPEDLAAKARAVIGADAADAAAYDAHRIATGVPQGGIDFAYNDAFPHETNMDRLHGVDFDKGCYIGQEVVSRMHHRGTARTRTLRVSIAGDAPAPGTAITAADKPVGTLGSSANGVALALLRTDRVHDALESGASLSADGHAIQLLHATDVAAPSKASA